MDTSGPNWCILCLRGTKWQAIITSLIVLGVSLAIWLPFVLWFDRVTTKRETEITNQKEVKING
uniref:Hypothetical transmembrane protein n=1 Tax=Spiroplasma citri TaxID=2133 RepID=Q14KE2_SPICI|nr:hypothetical transmembrane protein [Spiroplasma citri]